VVCQIVEGTELAPVGAGDISEGGESCEIGFDGIGLGGIMEVRVLVVHLEFGEWDVRVGIGDLRSGSRSYQVDETEKYKSRRGGIFAEVIGHDHGRRFKQYAR